MIPEFAQGFTVFSVVLLVFSLVLIEQSPAITLLTPTCTTTFMGKQSRLGGCEAHTLNFGHGTLALKLKSGVYCSMG